MIELRDSLFLFFILILLQSCATREYQKQESLWIMLKTPSVKYADLGFIYENEDAVKVEIYGSGKALMSLEISANSVCMSSMACMSKKRFNKEVLSEAYPDGIIEDIFRSKPLFDAKALMKNRNGFTQNIIEPQKYHIYYSVFNNETIFRDTINHIVIKLKRMGR